jgi:hypothetical protein
MEIVRIKIRISRSRRSNIFIFEEDRRITQNRKEEEENIRSKDIFHIFDQNCLLREEGIAR